MTHSAHTDIRRGILVLDQVLQLHKHCLGIAWDKASRLSLTSGWSAQWQRIYKLGLVGGAGHQGGTQKEHKHGCCIRAVQSIHWAQAPILRNNTWPVLWPSTSQGNSSHLSFFFNAGLLKVDSHNGWNRRSWWWTAHQVHDMMSRIQVNQLVSADRADIKRRALFSLWDLPFHPSCECFPAGGTPLAWRDRIRHVNPPLWQL